MIMDERAEFADSTALSTSGTGVANFGNLLDLGATTTDLGNGEPMYLVIQVDTAVTSAGAATVSFKLVSDSTSTISTSAATEHIITSAIAKATLVAGYTLVIPLPLGDYERYVAVQQNVATAALTAGNVSAFITADPTGKWKSYPDAVN